MADTYSTASCIWALGVTQIIGYGTLYYSFSILAPGIAVDLSVAVEWIYGCISLALLAGGLISPWAGGLADRIGAGKVMSIGSIGAAAALAVCGLAGSTIAFLAGMILVELTSAFVLYSTAFAFLAQTTGTRAQRSITYLTLIAGFASTIFWPLTTWLLHGIDWHQVYFLFAGLNLAVCLPLHLWLSRFARIAAAGPVETEEVSSPMVIGNANFVFVLIVLGFSLAGFVSAATLFHLVPMLGLLGLGTAGVWVASLLGPAQVASRLINMTFGKDLPATILAVVSAIAMPLALGTLALSSPSTAGAIAFAIVFGLGTGLFSIVSGTLPLAIFGKAGFGKRLGWIGMGRLGLSALAPFALSFALGAIGPKSSLWILAGAGLLCVGVFAEVWRRCRPVGSTVASSSIR
ncbi:arsenite efflux MFS transporter ArsK [Devosia ginsengisoli]|uniref:Arsenite efflux MFS transporter ArsK n=1 Tax=Devosia ginsengisoli TaxID=400770 RepID=A0A5B8LTP2_9HYPH|nr:arsenite efflux MFS transporter ArsK [Devosia ginsengisoli]QDZ11583.1 arsenite efflux MFS transporter ArsK [Devosia ginsengisoli]